MSSNALLWLLKVFSTWQFIAIVISCPAWGSHAMFRFGMGMALIGFAGAAAFGIALLWRVKP